MKVMTTPINGSVITHDREQQGQSDLHTKRKCFQNLIVDF
jgi:hypothetical protein